MRAPAFHLFRGDPFDRLLSRVGLEGRGAGGAVGRTLFLWGITWVPMAVAAALEGNLLGPTARASFLRDLAAWAQFWGFIPLSIFSEAFIGGKMRDALPYLERVADAGEIARESRRAERLARSSWAHLACAALAYGFSWLWARDEIANGLASWHSALAVGGSDPWFAPFVNAGEWFTVAGLWAAFVALPIFTFLWLRWVWKILSWTAFLYRVSRLKLRLMAVHPDRTGGLGCLSDVQTSFALILFGTGILFSAAIAYKLLWEGTELGSYTVWVPIVGYIFLAPAVFLAPLFLFTRSLWEARHAALVRLNTLVVEVAELFRERWLGATEPATGERDERCERGGLDGTAGTGGTVGAGGTAGMGEAGGAGGTADARAAGPLLERHSSNLADVHAAYAAVREMRIVPFDRRSALELFTCSAIPFAPLLFLAELPEKVDALFRLFG